ncbi:hypothetical protein WMQ40_00190 [Vibrio diabolicus]|uniref:hypothetical protein n=1 Tax=Vibrio diabolicus TaxID=50719 RepID=UPI001C9BC49E|nr:hypothetical protein [Vibrio parahaemolyticus]EJG1091309.1 hypothetical protein [Vibrio parahaemolyticus]MBY8272136.1 hypothetical protein [Vibrio fluvialis]HCH2796944.1 hypothetical protein [Vibrio parahaemolyticus]
MKTGKQNYFTMTETNMKRSKLRYYFSKPYQGFNVSFNLGDALPRALFSKVHGLHKKGIILNGEEFSYLAKLQPTDDMILSLKNKDELYYFCQRFGGFKTTGQKSFENNLSDWQKATGWPNTLITDINENIQFKTSNSEEEQC